MSAFLPVARRARRLAIGLVLLGVLLATAWIARAPLLRGAAGLWIVSDAVAPADAIAVLGGGLDVRPFAAAKYYHQRLAGRVLVASVRPGAAESIGVVAPHAELNRQVLLRLGVPADAVESFGSGLANTREEALALRAWAERARVRSLIVPTEVFSSRRVRWMLQHAFSGSGISVRVTAHDAPEYTRDDWWRHDLGLIAFQNEVLKYAYYRFKY